MGEVDVLLFLLMAFRIRHLLKPQTFFGFFPSDTLNLYKQCLSNAEYYQVFFLKTIH